MTPQVMNSAQPPAANVGNKLRQAQTKRLRLRRLLLKSEYKCSLWAGCLVRTVHRVAWGLFLMHVCLPSAYLGSLCLGFILLFFFQPLSH